MAENAGELGDMRDHLDAALAGFRALGDRWGLSIGLTLRAGSALMHGDLDAADAALEEAREQLDELDPAGGAGIIELRLADVAIRRGDLEAARRHAIDGRDRREVGSDDRAFAQAMLARVLLAQATSREPGPSWPTPPSAWAGPGRSGRSSPTPTPSCCPSTPRC